MRSPQREAVHHCALGRSRGVREDSKGDYRVGDRAVWRVYPRRSYLVVIAFMAASLLLDPLTAQAQRIVGPLQALLNAGESFIFIVNPRTGDMKVAPGRLDSPVSGGISSGP